MNRHLYPSTRWHAGRRDDRGSLPMALLLSMVGSALAAVLVMTIVTQFATTRFDSRRADALQVATAGLDVALGQIRAAGSWDSDSGRLIGDVKKLPCGTLTGQTASTSSGSFSVSITYFIADPSGQSSAWRASNAMNCTPGYGVYKRDTSTGTDIFVPSFALLTSTGKPGPNQPARALESTYPVFTSIWNSFGGAWVTGDGSNRLCVDGGSVPAVGATIKLQTCSAGSTPSASQSWAFLSNLTIQMTSTVGNLTLNPDGTGLCLRSPGTTSGNNQLTLDRCARTNAAGTPQTPTVTRMQWGVNDDGHFAEALSTGLSNNCIDNGNRTAGAPVLLKICTGGVDSVSQIFIAKYGFGAGKAGNTTSQLVNFGATSRCLDVTNQNVSSSFLILYTCKQTLASGGVNWNQRWAQVAVGDGTVQLVTNNGTAYCLTSPVTVGKYVTVTKCPSKPASTSRAQKWVVNQDADTNNNPLPLKTMYTIVDSYGNCLDSSSELYGASASPILVVSPCNGLATQKWNANPDPLSSKMTNLHEVTASNAG